MSSFFQIAFVIACETNLHMATAHNVLWAVVVININNYYFYDYYNNYYNNYIVIITYFILLASPLCFAQ